jgi:hypothetical protein
LNISSASFSFVCLRLLAATENPDPDLLETLTRVAVCFSLPVLHFLLSFFIVALIAIAMYIYIYMLRLAGWLLGCFQLLLKTVPSPFFLLCLSFATFARSRLLRFLRSKLHQVFVFLLASGWLDHIWSGRQTRGVRTVAKFGTASDSDLKLQLKLRMAAIQNICVVGAGHVGNMLTVPSF